MDTMETAGPRAGLEAPVPPLHPLSRPGAVKREAPRLLRTASASVCIDPQPLKAADSVPPTSQNRDGDEEASLPPSWTAQPWSSAFLSNRPQSQQGQPGAHQRRSGPRC